MLINFKLDVSISRSLIDICEEKGTAISVLLISVSSFFFSKCLKILHISAYYLSITSSIFFASIVKPP